MVGYAAPAFYTGSLKRGAPMGDGRLVLPGGRGVLTGSFYPGSTNSIINAEPAKLVYANGDTLHTGRVTNSQGSFSAHSMRSLYRYNDKRLALAVLKNERYEVVPEDPYIWHPFEGINEKLVLRHKALHAGRTTPRKALSAAENLVAWQPDTETLAALDKVLSYAQCHNLGGRWASQINLVQGLLAFFGPADVYAVIDRSEIEFRHIPFESYASQLEHVASTMFSATSGVTIKLFDGVFLRCRVKPDVTLQFHAETDSNMRKSFRFTMLEKAANLRAAYAHDEACATGELPTVVALLDGAFSKGPCHNGQLTAMFDILNERGALGDIMEQIPDLTGDINHDVSEVCLLFRKTCLKELREASPHRAELTDAEIDSLPEFEKAFTVAHFTTFLQGTERGKRLSAQEIADAVQWQVDVVGTLN